MPLGGLPMPLTSPSKSTHIDSLVRRLTSARVHPQVHKSGSAASGAGPAAAISIDQLLTAADDALAELAGVRNAAANGLPVTMMILGTEDTALKQDEISQLFRALAAQFDRQSLRDGRLGVATFAATFSSLDFAHLSAIDRAAREALGRGARYVLLDPDAGTDSVEADRLWRALHLRQQQPSPPRPAVAAVVSSQCELLGAEAAACLIPGTGIGAPLGSAWLPIKLNLTHISDTGGRVDEGALSAALDAATVIGDALLDELFWPLDSQQDDAYRNRRVVLLLEGIGDHVALRRENPTSVACLRYIDRLVRDVRDGLRARSHRLAKASGALPALAEREPLPDWSGSPQSLEWQRRWRQAFAETQVRHRNLLVISPYAVLPSVAAPASEYADLLPALGHADAFAFAGSPDIYRWNFNEFKGFYQRLLALVERHNAASFVAAGV